MIAADWIMGVVATALLCAAVVRAIRKTESRRRAADRRELRRAAERAYRGPHEVA